MVEAMVEKKVYTMGELKEQRKVDRMVAGKAVLSGRKLAAY